MNNDQLSPDDRLGAGGVSPLTPDAAEHLFRTGHVMIAGGGVAGRGVLTMLRALGSTVTIVDDNPTSALTLHEGENLVGVSEAITQLDGPDLPDLVVTSPGWRPDATLLVRSRERGVPVIGDIEAAWLADQSGAFGPARTWLAITGTNGKTTTTAMLTAMCVVDGRAAEAVGNIGLSPCVALTAQQRGEPRVDVMVAEVSSFQLHWAPGFTPDVGCILNLAEDHLDWHGTYARYAEAKAAVLRAPTAVIGVEEPDVLQLVDRLWPSEQTQPFTSLRLFSTDGNVTFPSRRSEAAVTVRDGHIVEVTNTAATVLAPAEGISPPGPAGMADACAAAAMARAIGVAPESIAQALQRFTVQAHRGQVVHESGGIQWIDNSKATNPHAAQAALRGMSNVVWVAGGQLKGADVSDLVQAVVHALKGVVLLGSDRHVIAEAVRTYAPEVPVRIIDDSNPESAMEKCVVAARAFAEPGSRVILAPAAASLDMYTGMSQRGDLFAEYAMGGEQ